MAVVKEGQLPRPRRPRERAADQEARILAGAIHLFAARGFQLSTRDLARHLGIAHSVLFRHFATKDVLLERVYQEIYLSKWDSGWEARLQDRALPLSARLLNFYLEYTAVICNPEWIRIFMFAGMKSLDINTRYFALLRQHILLPIARERRFERAALTPQPSDVSAADMERAWGLHGQVFYLAVRKIIYAMPVSVPLETGLKDTINIFMAATPDNIAPASVLQIPAAAAPKQPPAKPGNQSQRMLAAAREHSIVAGAIGFFAEHGTQGELRKLAGALGITHPLLYRYFPTKEALLARVYQEVYAGRWCEDWVRLLRDRSQPLAARLIGFYQSYLCVIDDRQWVRIFIFSGLEGAPIHRRYLDLIRQKLIEPVAEELCLSVDRPASGKDQVTDHEREMVWGLHGQIFYLVMRKWIYGIAPEVNPAQCIVAAVTEFVHATSGAAGFRA